MDSAVTVSPSEEHRRTSAQQEIERIAEVLLLLEVPPERASLGLGQLYKISRGEAIEIVRRVLTRRS
jgi:hypothetical protein